MGGKPLPTDDWTEIPFPCVVRLGRGLSIRGALGPHQGEAFGNRADRDFDSGQSVEDEGHEEPDVSRAARPRALADVDVEENAMSKHHRTIPVAPRPPISQENTGFRARLVNELVAPLDPLAKRYGFDEMIFGLLATAVTLRKLQAETRGEDLDLVREDILARLAIGFDAA